MALICPRGPRFAAPRRGTQGDRTDVCRGCGGPRAIHAGSGGLAALAAHPHMVTVYNADEHDGRLHGDVPRVASSRATTLRRRISVGGAMGRRRAAKKIARQISSALDAGRHAGLVHRDVEPANILIADRDSKDHAFVSDFGVSRLLSEADPAQLSAGSFVGAARYAGARAAPGRPGRRTCRHLRARLRAVRDAGRAGAVPADHARRSRPWRIAPSHGRGPLSWSRACILRCSTQ